ncbi:hypothetical protein EVJ27_12925 [Exiguobacterium sp. SH3S2]|uniref:hypothetical protein n=1 Tax=unclassified Exiguobacterium TaxID=2644629 RepID=UPI00103F9DE7|nr:MULTISPECIES: hypothetical protein [unclassified Exiguobacterium]TCI25592.1 hypothetical protein EVJ32_09735 [Exiguobacterium sp. SH5S4]TCI39815.1 hypothetical protein EVJ29_04035 [Exiguobacterium sp. SH4S7]TCI42102.1 hypothetical protein EVJ28_12820 [Exiguobacterium sp. SH3S3]TCI47493.1 hypothetical protein EVJ31_00170 [Exiguobacterium sp. SH5S32]TCI50279.1 hypothetical protein EVJ30_13205 [Exiguobacterium sp. SH5S13]
MKRLVGLLIITQTILFGMLIFQLNELADSVLQAASYVATQEGSLAWGGNISPWFLFLLLGLTLLGAYLTFSKE